VIRCTILEELSGDGVTVTVRVIEYWVTVEGQHVPEMFCLVTDLMDIDERPPADLAALYKWRRDGSETALREAKASLRGAGPSAGPIFRSGSPDLVRHSRPGRAPRRDSGPGPGDLPCPRRQPAERNQ
jgi:hypothetical protein